MDYIPTFVYPKSHKIVEELGGEWTRGEEGTDGLYGWVFRNVNLCLIPTGALGLTSFPVSEDFSKSPQGYKDDLICLIDSAEISSEDTFFSALTSYVCPPASTYLMKREDLPPDFPYKETSEYYSHIPEYRPGEVVYFAIHHTLSYYWYVVEILNTYNSSGGVVKVKYLETVQKAGIATAGEMPDPQAVLRQYYKDPAYYKG